MPLLSLVKSFTIEELFKVASRLAINGTFLKYFRKVCARSLLQARDLAQQLSRTLWKYFHRVSAAASHTPPFGAVRYTIAHPKKRPRGLFLWHYFMITRIITSNNCTLAARFAPLPACVKMATCARCHLLQIFVRGACLRPPRLPYAPLITLCNPGAAQKKLRTAYGHLRSFCVSLVLW